MKKFLKVFIVVLLVLAVIAITCFFFFKNYKEKKLVSQPIIEILDSESKSDFDVQLKKTAIYLNADEPDSRLQAIISTSENLDEILYELSSYYVSSNTLVNDKEIVKSLNSVQYSRNVLMSMMNEYEIKITSAYFNRHLGVNDLLKQYCGYLVEYGRLINLVNSSLAVDRNSDLRFNAFNIYANVVISTFEKTKLDETTKLIYVEDLADINILNDNDIVAKSFNNYSIDVNLFNKFYNYSNATTFAKNLSENVQSVTTMSGTNEQIATYYFKLIYGI